jgi:hypothetical protein
MRENARKSDSMRKTGPGRDIHTPQKFESLLSARAFPGRKTLYISEVAQVLRIDEKQVTSLIEEGQLGAIDIAGAGNKSDRRYYRIPVCEYDAYIMRRLQVPA